MSQQILLTTTGTPTTVIIDDLGGRTFTHPTTSFDLLSEYRIEDIRDSFDLQNLIDTAAIILTDDTLNTILNLKDNLENAKLRFDENRNNTVDNATQLNGQIGSFYLTRSNHTGTQSASSISDFNTAVQTVTATSGTSGWATNAANAHRLNSQLPSFYLDRANHTGTQPVSTLSNMLSGTAGYAMNATSAFTAINANNLNNQTPAFYLARANHTGTQTAATISDFVSVTNGLIGAYGTSGWATNAANTHLLNSQNATFYLTRSNHTGAIAGPLFMNNNLNVSGNANIQGTLYSTSGIGTPANAIVGGNINVTGDVITSAGNFTTTTGNISTQDGSITSFNGNIGTTGGNISTSVGNVSGNTMTSASNATFGTAPTHRVNVAGQIFANGNINTLGNVNIQGTLYSTSGISTPGNLSAGSLTITGATAFSGNLNVTGQVFSIGDLNTNSDINATGTIHGTAGFNTPANYRINNVDIINVAQTLTNKTMNAGTAGGGTNVFVNIPVTSFQNYFQLVEVPASASTNSTTPQTRVTLVTPYLPSGKYRVIVHWMWLRDSAANSAQFDVTLNGVTQGTSMIMEAGDTTDNRPETKILYLNLVGTNTILLRYWGESGANSTTISNASIAIERVM